MTTPPTQPRQPESELESVAVVNLRFDPKNPRLSLDSDSAGQDALLKEVISYDIEDLLTSLARNGYFDEEPLIAVKYPSRGGQPQQYVVVEGNRRLAALKLLTDEHARGVAGGPPLPTVSEMARARLDPVPVRVYQNRDQIIPYLGVRHISGIKQWNSMAKARYIENMVHSGTPMLDVAQMVGMGRRIDVVRRWLLTLYVLRQANNATAEPWPVSDREFDFSFLYTALGYATVREQVGLDSSAYSDPAPNPVPEEATETLVDIMLDLYGSPDGERRPKIRESRQIKQLASVYESGEATRYLRAGASLDEAYRKSPGERQELIGLLDQASFMLGQANAIAVHHRGNQEAARIARRCYDTADVLLNTLEPRTQRT
ncbi:MAG: hypothetical protein WD208_13075 [Dehalococcoidia bacterium]